MSHSKVLTTTLLNTMVLVFREQEINIHEQLDLARHFGPLHKHASTPIPREPGLEEVHGRHPISSITPGGTQFLPQLFSTTLRVVQTRLALQK